MSLDETRLSEKRAILTVKGRLDATTAPNLKARLKNLIDAGYVQLVVDLTDVSFIDSSGLAALVSGLKAARDARGALKLAGLGEQAQTVLRLTLLDRVFESHPDVDAALRALPAV